MTRESLRESYPHIYCNLSLSLASFAVPTALHKSADIQYVHTQIQGRHCTHPTSIELQPHLQPAMLHSSHYYFWYKFLYKYQTPIGAIPILCLQQTTTSFQLPKSCTSQLYRPIRYFMVLILRSPCLNALINS